MTRKYIANIVVLLFVLNLQSSFSQQGYWEWARRYGGVGGVKEGYSVAIDANRNIYVAGSFYSDLTIDGITLHSMDFNDVFIAKFSEAGNLIWIKHARGPYGDQAITLVIKDNFIYVAGHFDFELTFDDTYLNVEYVMAIFLAKLDLEGNLIWLQYEGTGGSGACIEGLSLVDLNNEFLCLTGCFTNDYTYDNRFIAKYDTAGNEIWRVHEKESSHSGGRSVAVDNFGNILNTGYFKDTVTFGDTTLISKGNRDIYYSKYDLAGNLIWVKQAGGVDFDVGHSIATDHDNNIYVTGNFRDTTVVEDTILISRGINDIFLLKLDPDGNRKWVKQFGDSGSDQGRYIFIDTSDNLYLIGYFQDTVSLGDTILISNSTDYVASNAFIAKLSSEGEFLWIKQIGSYWDIIGELNVDANGNVYTTGSIQGATVYLDDIVLPPVGNADLFIAKITENPVLVETIDTKLAINIYPNPFTDMVNLEFNSIYNGSYILNVYSLSGEIVISKRLEKYSFEINEELDLKMLDPGVYFLNIAGKNYNRTVKIVKQ